MTNPPLIHCKQLILDSESDETRSHTLELNANAGTIISIIGPDQSLKSNYLKTIAGVMEPRSGQLYLAGKETQEFNKEDWVRTRTQFAYVHAYTAVLSAANALQNLMLPAMYHKTGDAEVIRAKAEQLLEDIHAGDGLDQLPAYLTKEQQYKIAVARSLMLDPQVLLFDSPFTALELSSIQQFQQFLLNRIKADNLLLILVTHDIKFALQHSDQIIYLSESHLLQFNKTRRIQDCDNPEVCNYIKI